MASILQLLLFLLVLFLMITMVSHGLELKLIHRDSVDSPFRTNNLTTLQKLELDVQTSMHAASILEGGNNIHPLRALMLHRSDPIYIILVAIGTPGTVQRLSFDITQSFTWVHCDPCNPCPVSPAATNVFVPGHSTTYTKVLNNDSACAWIRHGPPAAGGGFCRFNYTFPPWNTSILGTLSRDILSISMVSTTPNLSPADLITLPSFSFGCVHNSTTNPGPGDAGVNGVFGLGHRPLSILRQSSLVPLSFSYCLVCPETYPAIPSYLRFFRDSVPRQPSYYMTRIENQIDDILGSYYLKVYQLSLNGVRLLNARNSQFARQDGKGGVVISTATTVTFLIRPVYDIVRQQMMEYAERHGWTSSEQTIVALDLCYDLNLSSGNNTQPTMTFHFSSNASLLVEPSELFVTHMSRLDSFFCLNILPSDHSTIIGTRMQHNYRFYFDVKLRQLTFHREDCHLEGQAGN